MCVRNGDRALKEVAFWIGIIFPEKLRISLSISAITLFRI